MEDGIYSLQSFADRRGITHVANDQFHIPIKVVRTFASASVHLRT